MLKGSIQHEDTILNIYVPNTSAQIHKTYITRPKKTQKAIQQWRIQHPTDSTRWIMETENQ